MESVRRSQRVRRTKLGTEAVAETPVIEKKIAGRQPSVRKALVDVTNTCSIKPDGPSRIRVAKNQSDSNEVGNQSVSKLAVKTPLLGNAKNSRKAVASNTVISSSSLKESRNISVIATAKDPTVRAVRVRKTKEQAPMVGSKVEPSPILVEIAKTAAVVATPKETASKTSGVRKAKEPAPAVGGKVLSAPISVDLSEASSIVSTPQDPVVKVVRGRKAKEQAQSESNSGITDASELKGIVAQDISMTNQNISGPKTTKKKCTGGQRSSGCEQSTGVFKERSSVVLKAPPVQQTVRRNVARRARKPINYAEDDDLGSNKISTFLSGTSIKRNDPSSRKVELPTVKQTMRKGRRKIAGPTIAPTPSCIEKPLYDGSIDLLDDVIAIPSTIESSFEEEYERFKLEKLACENGAKKPLPAVTIESVESTKQTLTQSADSVALEEQCLSVVPSVEFARDVVNSEEAARTPGRKFIHATRSPIGMVQVSPNLHTAKVSERGVITKVEPVVHVTKHSLSGEPGAELSPQTTTIQRGQKRGRKENNVMTTSIPFHTSEPERLLVNADFDAKPSYISPPHDVSATTASDDLDKDIREFNGPHSHDEQVDTDKNVGMAKDDPNRAVFEHEDQVCVDVSGKECNTSLSKPLSSFDEAVILKKLKDCCKTLGKPSPLQAHALPFLLAGRDLVAISESHAGYVHAYAVPVLQHVLKNKKRYVRKQPSPQCLILADSPEVAQEITDSLEESYGSLRVKIAKAVEDPENVLGMEFVKPGVAVLVTTPNCLEKMLRDGTCSLALASFIVLDGADCMVNNGYEESLRSIFDQASKCLQTGVFSSTWESKTEQLVEMFIPNSDTVKVIVSKSVDTQEQLPGEQVVHQIVEVLEESNKDTRLTALLRTFQKGQKNRVLVYVLYKEEALHVEGLLQHRGWIVASVHGGIFEADRNKAVVSFQKGASSVLVATDVAARGLAIPNVDYVINYSFPYTLCDYARRLEQTGRSGRRGIMHTFFLPSNQGRAKELVEVLREAGQNVPEELLHLTSPAKKKPRTEY